MPLTPDSFKDKVTVTDADLTKRFEANKESYRIGEKRKVKYALLEVDKVRETVAVPDAEVEAFYNQNKAQYTTAGRVRASHILLKTDGKDEAAVKAKAEALLAQAKAPGADFAALAKAILRRRGLGRQRRRSQRVRSRPDGAGVRTGRLWHEGRRDQRSRQDHLWLPHHQGHREPARDQPAAGRGASRRLSNS